MYLLSKYEIALQSEGALVFDWVADLRNLPKILAHVQKVDIVKEADGKQYYAEHTKSIFGKKQLIELISSKSTDKLELTVENKHPLFLLWIIIRVEKQENGCLLHFENYTRRSNPILHLLFKLFFVIYRKRYEQGLQSIDQFL